MGRFINADAYTSTGQGVLGNNMFAYCENSPIINVDFGGAKPCLVNRCAKWEGADLLIPIVDLTEKLNEFMIENATKLQEYRDTNGFIEAAFYFLANVVDGGELDIKLQDDWKFEEDKVYKYNETFLRYDDPGNLNFGYVGAVLFSEEFLCFGAGLNQISKYGFAFGDISTFYDDPRDNIMIKLVTHSTGRQKIMNKLAATLRVAIASSLLIYLNTLTVMFLPYCNISPFFIQLGFVALCTISILVSFAAILHKNRSVFQSVLRWFFTLVFFVGFFLLSAYTGLVELLCNLFNINTNSSADNASGLLTLSYFFVVFISGFLIVLWKLSTILLRKLTARRKTP